MKRATSAAVDVVAHLLALVAEDPVLAALEVALHQVAQKAVQLDAASDSGRSGSRRADSRSACRSSGRTPAP